MLAAWIQLQVHSGTCSKRYSRAEGSWISDKQAWAPSRFERVVGVAAYSYTTANGMPNRRGSFAAIVIASQRMVDTLKAVGRSSRLAKLIQLPPPTDTLLDQRVMSCSMNSRSQVMQQSNVHATTLERRWCAWSLNIWDWCDALRCPSRSLVSDQWNWEVCWRAHLNLKFVFVPLSVWCAFQLREHSHIRSPHWDAVMRRASSPALSDPSVHSFIHEHRWFLSDKRPPTPLQRRQLSSPGGRQLSPARLTTASQYASPWSSPTRAMISGRRVQRVNRQAMHDIVSWIISMKPLHGF